VAQASRLFDIPEDVCRHLLGTLVEQRAIHMRSDGRFVAATPLT
jgi:hypothetical protein